MLAQLAQVSQPNYELEFTGELQCHLSVKENLVAVWDSSRGVLISEGVLYTSLCSWDSRHCPHGRGDLISEVVLFTSLCSLDSKHCPHWRGDLISEVVLFTSLYVAGTVGTVFISQIPISRGPFKGECRAA